ncbi:MAG: hypothetical protein K6G29_12690, partial [Clostridiales bacterium]|nr:hypothetical protein [Clostridiales bacterium]
KKRVAVISIIVEDVSNIETARMIFDRTVRAACGFESLYVREDAADYSTARMRVHLYARFDRRRKAKKVRFTDFFACFG